MRDELRGHVVLLLLLALVPTVRGGRGRGGGGGIGVVGAKHFGLNGVQTRVVRLNLSERERERYLDKNNANKNEQHKRIKTIKMGNREGKNHLGGNGGGYVWFGAAATVDHKHNKPTVMQRMRNESRYSARIEIQTQKTKADAQ